MNEADAVRSLITDAWRDVPYTEELDQLLCQDSGWPETNELQEELRGMKWDEVPGEMSHRGYASLKVLDNRAWPYYLPAMMLGAMSGGWAEALVDSLSSPRHGEAAATLQRLVDALDATQRQAVIAFLRFMLDVFDQEMEPKYATRYRRRVEEAISLFWAPGATGFASAAGLHPRGEV